jgi:hypothetical protein
MRRITFFKTLLVAIALVIGSISASAQLLVEDFNYTVGTVLTGTATADPTTGWLSHSGNGGANIDVTNGLTFTGYAGSGVGGAANVDNTGQDINKTFTSQTSGIIYVAFMLQTSSTNSVGYFFMLSPTPVSMTFNSRIFVNGTGDGIGLSATSTAPGTYVAITPGTTVLVVIKHNFTANTTDMFVLNSFSATEPITASQSILETYTTTGAVAIRQYSATQKQIIDGIRVGTVWSDACAAPGNPKAATPTFSATPGNVINPQSVSLSCTTAGASIYYTTDGITTPDNVGNGLLYDGITPIAVSSTTTIKAIAYFTGMDASSVATGIYTFPTEVANVAALRAASTSGFYKLTGEALLTYQSVAGKAKYLQDATAGIVIYDGSSKITTPYNIGDKISNIYCTLSMYNGMLELIPFADPGAAVSTGNTVTPTIVTLANIANYPGQLVIVKNVAITGTGNFVSAIAYPINDGTAGVLRTAYSDLPYIGSAIPSTNQDITGVVNMYSVSEADLIPRTAADMINTTITALNQASTNTSIYFSKGNVVLSAVAGETVEIYNVVGQRLVHKLTNEGVNTIPVSAQGVVLVKVGNRFAKVIL